METFDCQMCRVERESSYRTYEEWKHLSRLDKRFQTLGSYRTYEEWKPVTPSSYKTSKSGSYRTYEEWKLGGEFVDFCE